MSANPHILLYIHELQLVDNSSYTDTSGIIYESYLPSFLSSLANLTKLTIESNKVWSNFPTPLQTTFIGIFEEQLERLCMIGIHSIPSSLFVTFKNLLKLSLVRVTVLEDYIVMPSSLTMEIPRLESLNLEAVAFSLNTALRVLLAPGSTFPSLSVLVLGPEDDDEVESFWEVASAASETLQTFSLTYEYTSSLRELTLARSPLTLA